MSRPSLQLLKEQIGALVGVRSREYFPCSLIKGGMPRSALIEVTGSAKLSFICRFLKENPEPMVIWIQDKAPLFPPALAQQGAGLQRITFIEKPDLDFHNIRLVARSKTVPILIAPSHFDEDELKRLKLFAEDAKICLILIAQKLTSAYAITVQIQADHDYDPVPNPEQDESASPLSADLRVTVHKYKCEGEACE